MTHQRLFASGVALLFASGFAMSMMNCGSDNTPSCLAGYEKCPCAKNDACLTGLVCLSNICVNPGTTTAAGTTAATTTSGGTGGGGTTGSGGGTTGTGGATAATTTSGAGGGGTGGGSATGPCGTNVIDDFSSCDTSICNTDGRSGTWHTVMDNGAGETFTVSTPDQTQGWQDLTCAAWTYGGGGGAYVGFGTQLAGGAAYDLSKWSGMTLLIESTNPTWLQLVAMDGGVFQTQIMGMAGTSSSHQFKFTDLQHVGNTPGSATLDLTKITSVQLMADMPSGFGYALHRIVLDP